MAEPFDHRDITLTGGGGRNAKITTNLETATLSSQVTKKGVRWKESAGTPTNGETTFHDARVFKGSGGAQLVAKIVYQRVVTPNTGGSMTASPSDVRPEGDFEISEAPSTNPDATITESSDGGQVQVKLWAFPEAGFNKSVSAGGGVINVKITSGSASWWVASVTLTETAV